MTDHAATEILSHGARALAHGTSGEALHALLRVIVAEIDVESAVIVAGTSPDDLSIVAAVGVGEPATAALSNALRNPAHPIARTVADPLATFDVLPSQPGGPALRSHLPLVVEHGGDSAVLGVLALAHHGSLGEDDRRTILAAADLAAVALERR